MKVQEDGYVDKSKVVIINGGSKAMVINNTEEYDTVWNKVYEKLKFQPSCDYRGHSLMVSMPFDIQTSYSIYAIDQMREDQIDLMDNLIRRCLNSCVDDNRKWYALDWQHSAFSFHPMNEQEQQSIWIEEKNALGGEYYAYFPSFYPDGDYYFFVDEKFENGYLGHPWRQEVWIFGERLQFEIKKVYSKLGWYCIK